MKKKNPFKSGDKVKYKDGDTSTYTVYGIYSPTMVSLGLKDYPDTEQDFQIHISKIKRCVK